ncbi:50S ribosomal protein L11 methyltransferase [Armatimonas sp.]|uniref:50S ribosomal protein L11 methyltransferase n=1 Tax=Armatimonas sp. TaxID=1872638 RepID=UPI00286C1284|nr:50S ribosomal protein L11 methyltransferase [Armatimonas sp.]
MRWAEIEIAAVGDDQELYSTLLTEVAGCQGFSADSNTVKGYLPVDERLEGSLLALRTAAGRDVTIRFVQEEDWANAWKQYFKPQRIGERIVVKPSWEAFSPKPDDLVVEMDPGMAFGTGLHATTRLCLRALEQHVKGGETIADVGTGSGILAIAAILLGAKSAICTDIDPLAVRIAWENIERNKMIGTVEAVEATLPPPGQFDIVVANILPDVILGMADELIAATKPGGLLIVSGIIESRTEDVNAGLMGHGLKILAVETEGEWVGILARQSS